MDLNQSKICLGLLLVIGMGGLANGLPAQARNGNDCPGFRVIRDRSDSEVPRLPRVSIAARAIQSQDGCDRSQENDQSSRPPRETRSNSTDRPSTDSPAPPEPTPR